MKRGSNARGARDFIGLTVLALLLEAPRHPYEMQRLMRERHKDFAIGKTRSFYDAVERLQEHGLIEPSATTREGHHPERTVYRISQAGVEELRTWLAELLSTVSTEYPSFTVALNFLPCLSPQAALWLLRQRAATLEGLLAGLDATLQALTDQLGLPRLFLLEVEHTRALRRAELEWVRTIAEDIQAGRLEWHGSLELDDDCISAGRAHSASGLAGTGPQASDAADPLAKVEG
jgi:DNA-binding PadR family transcriptional regulator